MTKWLIANWKMNGNAEKVRAFALAINQQLCSMSGAKAVFCPPEVYISEAKRALPHNASLLFGAQNCHHATAGAFTGETAAAMLAEMGASHVILGHSERRASGETDAAIQQKAKAALAAGLTPILCVGESRAQYEAGKTATILTSQLAEIKTLPLDKILIAYEPVWAIGTGLVPKMADISAAHAHIKSVLGSGVSVLYGGSVNPSNIGEILALPEVSGALIGGASLEIETMLAMLESAAK